MSTSLMQIDCQRLARYDSMYARAELFNPKRVYNLLIGTAWSIVSKADDKSAIPGHHHRDYQGPKLCH